MIGKDVKGHLKKSEPEIKKAKETFRCLHQVAFDADNFPLVSQEGEEMEVTMTLAEGDYRLEPDLSSLGIWETAEDYPRKLSG